MPKIAVLYEAGQAVLSTFDLDEVLQRILAIARDYFRLRNVAILLLDKEAKQIYAFARRSAGIPGKDKICLGLARGHHGRRILQEATRSTRPM